jgi:hypothetical protein
MNFQKRNKQQRNIINIAIFMCVSIFMITAPDFAVGASYQYKMLETFPGFFAAGSSPDLPQMILAIYKFGIWTVGIAGLFMLTIGGFMYMLSAGNNATVTSAKGIIGDSLLGIVAALGAYLIMYVINPDLTNINIAFTAAVVEGSEGTPMGTIDSSTGKYKTISEGNCSVTNLTALNKTSSPSTWAAQASCICSGESGGKSIPSSVDICADGTPASYGLFQINITANGIDGYNCPAAFSGGAYTSKNHACQLKTDAASQALYQNCKNAAMNPDKNIAAAYAVYSKGNNWKPWGAKTKCGL